MSISPIKTAIIGYGFSAKTFHLPFVDGLPEFELTAISSRQVDTVKADWPNAVHYLTAEQLLENSDAELVIITSPNDTHFELAKRALENNKHVIIEKPFVTKVSDGEALIELAEQKGLVLSVYHNRRWDGDFLTVKKMIADKRLGNVKCFESHFDRFRPEVRQRWRELSQDGGGLLFDLGPHLMDQALDLFGLPDAITAQCLVMRDGSSNVDYFNVVMQYPDFVVTLHSDLFSAGPNRRFHVKGDLGSYEKYGLDPQEERLIAGVMPNEAHWAAETQDQYGSFYSADGVEVVTTELGGYQHYFVSLAESIRGTSLLPVSAEQALWNIKLIELALESSQLGQTLQVVK